LNEMMNEDERRHSQAVSIISPPRYWLPTHKYQAPVLLYMKIHVANRYRLSATAIDLVVSIIKKLEREPEERGCTRLRLNSSGPYGSFCAEVFSSANFCRYRPRIRFDVGSPPARMVRCSPNGCTHPKVLTLRRSSNIGHSEWRRSGLGGSGWRVAAIQLRTSSSFRRYIQKFSPEIIIGQKTDQRYKLTLEVATTSNF
jgi:hypothetical protein